MIGDLFLFASVASTPVAIPASELEAVVRLGEIVPVARSAPYLRGLAALRSRVLTIIDVRARIVGELTALPHDPLAIVAMIDGHGYGLIVDAVSDIGHPAGAVETAHGRVDACWQPFVHGMLVHEQQTHIVVSVHDLALASSSMGIAA